MSAKTRKRRFTTAPISPIYNCASFHEVEGGCEWVLYAVGSWLRREVEEFASGFAESRDEAEKQYEAAMVRFRGGSA